MREWRVPASRMKAGAEHRVPLSDAAVAVLEGMKAQSDGAADSLVFPGVGGRPLNGDTLIKALRRATGTDADVHGFRSSFRTVGRRAVRGDKGRGGDGPCTRGRRGSRAELRAKRSVRPAAPADGQMGRVRDRPRAYPVTRPGRRKRTLPLVAQGRRGRSAVRRRNPRRPSSKATASDSLP